MLLDLLQQEYFVVVSVCVFVCVRVRQHQHMQ